MTLSKKYGVLGNFPKKTLEDVKSQEKKKLVEFKKRIKLSPEDYKVYLEVADFYRLKIYWELDPKLISDDKIIQKYGTSFLATWDAKRLGVKFQRIKERDESIDKYDIALEDALKKCHHTKNKYCREIYRFELEAVKYYNKALRIVNKLVKSDEVRVEKIKKLKQQLSSDGSLLLHSITWKDPNKWQRCFPRLFPTKSPYGIRLYKEKNLHGYGKWSGQMLFFQDVRDLKPHEKKTMDMPNSFAITKDERTWYFSAGTSSDRDIWMKIFKLIWVPALGTFYDTPHQWRSTLAHELVETKTNILMFIADSCIRLFEMAKDKKHREKWRHKAIQTLQKKKRGAKKWDRNTAEEMIQKLKAK